jgi:hypothetical protein
MDQLCINYYFKAICKTHKNRDIDLKYDKVFPFHLEYSQTKYVTVLCKINDWVQSGENFTGLM